MKRIKQGCKEECEIAMSLIMQNKQMIQEFAKKLKLRSDQPKIEEMVESLISKQMYLTQKVKKLEKLHNQKSFGG